MRRRDALPDPAVDHGLRELEAALAGEPGADPELALLVADVGAARPQPGAPFLASLDARVHAGFPREDATPRRPREPWHVRVRRPADLLPSVGALVAAAVVALLVAGLPNGAQDQNSSSLRGSGAAASAPAADSKAAPTVPSSRPAVQTSAAATSTSQSSRAPAPAPPLPALPDARPRKVQRAAALTLTPPAADVQDTADGVVRETQAAGGYVQRSQVATQDGGGTASFTLRIPSARLDDALARLSRLAHVGALTQAATDITATSVSAADRLADARAERRALLRALARATTGRQIASLRARIRDNRSLIAQRQGALDAVRRRADLATVTVAVEGTDRPSGGGGWTPRDALRDAGRVLEVAGGVLLIALAVLAPLAVLGALAWLGTRAARRRRRETALDRTV
jgi:hypothetical protein